MKTKFVIAAALFTTLAGFSQKQWTLKECVNHALENNITIKQNMLNIDIAEADVKSARGNKLPSLSGSTGGNLRFGSGFDPVSQDRVSTSNFGGSFGLSTGITVFNGYRVLNTYKQAKLGVEGSKLDLEVIENDIALRVVNSYLNALFAKENLLVATTQAAISKKQIERAKAQFEAGAVPKSDLLNVQSTASNDVQNLVAQENALNLALLNISQLLQVPFNGFDVAKIEIDSPSAAMLYSTSEEVYKKALTNRPEITRAKLNIENADLSIAIARSAYMPSVTASGNVGTNYGYNLDLPTGFSNTGFLTQLDNNLGYGIGFNVSIPIFNGFKTDASVERSKISKLITETRLESQKLQLQQTIEKSFQDAKAASKSFEAAEISLEAQKEAFKNAQVSYDYGSMTQFDYDQVRNRLVNAESALIRAKYNYVFTTKVLKFYYGEDILLD
ncbi:TolC family protein [Tenacibaculum haliotis]|uniref:TolC family protein n=1 Tax=Tenacibaculum haliotis TaxID=1888914 RepID=UPI0021AFED43|nr:TolC family protein [Tenacibaculum haliotis]MCT4698125.1 TolC family protein [Tenacibaculum haliotis]